MTYTSNCCPKCGGAIIGDGYTSPLRCEYAEADAAPQYCDFTEEEAPANEPSN